MRWRCTCLLVLNLSHWYASMRGRSRHFNVTDDIKLNGSYGDRMESHLVGYTYDNYVSAKLACED